MEAAKLHREAAAVAQSLEGGGSGSAGSTGWRMRRGGRMVAGGKSRGQQRCQRRLNDLSFLKGSTNIWGGAGNKEIENK